MHRSYWDYDSVNIQWGVLENYEVVRKIGTVAPGDWDTEPLSSYDTFCYIGLPRC